MHLLLRFIVSAIVLGLILNFVPGFHNAAGVQQFGIGTILIVAIVFGIINALIGPILRLLSAPLTWITHGLFSIVVNWILFGLTVWIVPNVKGGWLPTLIGAIIMMIVTTIIAEMWKPRSETVSA
ncbi:MAG: phage holin family protein [Candidatus Eremiobacteraeota bacterium]|nr:phage holin family protein [Candidatus Eremiobacteraeota bacterium]